MRKYGRKYALTVWVCFMLFLTAVLNPGMYITDRMIVLAMMAVVACVYIISETKIDCAAAPLNLPESWNKPPESDED